MSNTDADPSKTALGITTPQGTFVAIYSRVGLAGLRFPGPERHAQPPQQVPRGVQEWHTLTERAVRKALAGDDPGPLPPLDLSSGTEFQQSVWRAMQAVGPGSTCSYAELACAIARPKAVRAVGGACGANPIPVLIPCHRIVASGGRIGGFSGGLQWKRFLLGVEQGDLFSKEKRRK